MKKDENEIINAFFGESDRIEIEKKEIKIYCPCALKIRFIGKIFCIINIIAGIVLFFVFMQDWTLSHISFVPPIIAILNCILYPFIKGFAYIVANNEIKFYEKYKKQL